MPGQGFGSDFTNASQTQCKQNPFEGDSLGGLDGFEESLYAFIAGSFQRGKSDGIQLVEIGRIGNHFLL